MWLEHHPIQSPCLSRALRRLTHLSLNFKLQHLIVLVAIRCFGSSSILCPLHIIAVSVLLNVRDYSLRCVVAVNCELWRRGRVAISCTSQITASKGEGNASGLFSQMTNTADQIRIDNDKLPSILVGNDVLLPVKIDITTNGNISWISISIWPTQIVNGATYHFHPFIQVPDMSTRFVGNYTTRFSLRTSLPGDYVRIWTYHSVFKVASRFKFLNRWHD